MQADNKMKIYYLRLSKEDGDVETGAAEESCSINSQRICIHRYIKSIGLDPKEFIELADDGFTGTNMNRPGMQKILNLVATGRVGMLIVRDLSRFSRDYLEAGHYLEYVFPYHNVRFVSINDDYDSLRFGELTGGLELAIKNLVNQMYSKDISRKIKSAVDLKKLSGEYVYGTAPYGYKKGEVRNTIVVDDKASGVVQDIFNWAASGITVTEIAKKLNALEVTTPSVYLAQIRGKYKTRSFWTFESVRNILTNRIYTGDTVPFKSHVVRVGSNRVKPIPEELQTVIPNTHEAIISRELYYQAHTVIKSNKKTRQTGGGYLFTSILECACCGNKLTRGKKTNKYWLCSSRRYTDSTKCKLIRVADSTLENIVLKAITTQCRLLDEKIAVIKAERHKAKSSIDICKNEIKKLRSKIKRLEDEKIRLYEDYADGNISMEEYKALKESTKDELNSFMLKLAVSENQLNDLNAKMSVGAKDIEESRQLSSYSEIEKLTPALVKELIKRIVVSPEGSIKIEWNFKDEIAEILNENTLIEYAV